MDFLSPEIKDYAQQNTSPASAVLEELDRETNLEVLYPRMLSGHLQGRILAFLSKMKSPHRILEVGTYTGYSAICLAEGLGKEGKLITIEVNPELEERAVRYFAKAGYADQIEMRIGSAGEIIPKLEDKFDLAFIDADKENYNHYFELILSMMNPGGVILADNVLWSGRVLAENVVDKETKALKDFVKFVGQDSRVEQVLLPVRDGILMVRKL